MESAQSVDPIGEQRANIVAPLHAKQPNVTMLVLKWSQGVRGTLRPARHLRI